MKSSQLALIQFNPIIGNPEYNAIRIIEKLENSKKNGSELAIFGELALTGYYAQDLFLNDDLMSRCRKSWKKIKYAATKLNIGICLGMPTYNKFRHEGAKHLFNTIKIFIPGEKVQTQHKVCIPTYSEFDEDRWFQSSPISQVTIKKVQGQRIGFVICEDGWNNKYGINKQDYRLYKEDPISKLIEKTENTPDLLINISASPDYIGKQNIRIKMNKRIAKKYKTPIIFLNLVGAQDELIFSGRSFIINAQGNLVKQMIAFEEAQFSLNLADIEGFKTVSNPNLDKMEILDGLIGLYLRDYFYKSGLATDGSQFKINKKLFKNEAWPCKITSIKKSNNIAVKTILGMSGGKDSTAVACILKRHLGKENVLGVMMPYRMGEYSQKESKKLARKLAKKLQIEIREIPIDKEVESLKKTLKLKTATLAHQNLQARIRATILWSIANSEGRVVMNTTNFSEAAMGYGTIGGDLLGLPLIASLPATTVIEYLQWLKEHGERAITDDMVNRKPSAELAPDQFDKNELGDYSYIDPIIESLRMNYGDVKKVINQFIITNKKKYRAYNGSKKKRRVFIDKLKFLSKKLLIQSEFKRWYYNKTPQFTPYSWLRWKWPLANGFMDIERYINEIAKKKNLI